MSQYDRQSFLGADSTRTLAQLTVGIIGLGGGGSHVVQQLAHIGVGRYVLVDPDIIEDSNLNRLVGATIQDVKNASPKVDIAWRVVNGLIDGGRIDTHQVLWQEALAAVKACDVIVGGLDSVVSKDELDGFCKRFMIPYIDMGMDVHDLGDQFLVAGQVVLTSPGGPCLRCLGIVTEQALSAEAARYGAAGSKPQVVWPNGVLASTAVGLLVQLVSPWNKQAIDTAYLQYDGNKHTVVNSPRFRPSAFRGCPHHPPNETGDPRVDIRKVVGGEIQL